MCSGGKCDLPGLIGGPVGNIVGMGVKALLNNGGAIGPRSAEALRTPTDKENIQQFYDKVEAHLKGALQILQPALELKRALTRECKSAEPDRQHKEALTPAAAILYYSPQNPISKSQAKNRSYQCCAQKKLFTRISENSSTLKAPKNHCNKSKAEISQSISSTAPYERKKGAENKCSPCSAGETNGKSSSSRYESKGKACNASTNKSVKSKQAQCCMCNISLKENTVLAVLPCEHLFCYTCLGKAKIRRCPKCEKSFNMKNVSQIFVTE